MLSALKPALSSESVCFIIMAVGFLSSCVSVSQSPTMSCPGVQVGQEGRNITCVTGADARSISLSRKANTLVQCNTTSCSGDQGYSGLVTVNDTNLTVSMTIESVQGKDESMWTCHVDFGGESKEANETCLLFIFVPPEKPVCDHTFNETHVLITCSTAKVYPRATCRWNASSVPKVRIISYSHPVSKDPVFIFNTTCTAVFPVTNQTEYTLHVSFYPAGFQDEDISGGAAVETQDIVITVAPPKGPPSLMVSPNQEQYMELDNVTISCTVHSGSPPVYRTSLECDTEFIDTGSGSNNVTVQGHVVKMDVQLNGEMHGKSCTCSGSHVTSTYQLVNKLTFVANDNSEDSNEPQGSNSSHGPGPLRKYTLHITSGHNEPPVCPTNLKLKLTPPGTVSLSWKYVSHDRLQQTFNIFSHDESTVGSRDSRTKVAEVNGTKEDDMEYNITGLSKLSRFSFSLTVRNKAGERACPEVSVNVTTKAGEHPTTILPTSPAGPNTVFFIISIACLLLPAIIIVIIVVIVRRRQDGYSTGLLHKKKNSEHICNKELYAVTHGGPARSSDTGDLVIVGPKFKPSDFEKFKLRPHVNREPRGELSDYENTPGKTADELDRRLTGRKGSGEGSAYFNVEINPNSKHPVIKERSDAKESERVEYLTLSKSNVSVGDDVTEVTCNTTWLTL